MTAVIVLIVLPYILAVASVLPAGPAEWLLRVTPAAAFAVQQTLVRYHAGRGALHPQRRLLPARTVGGPCGAVRLHAVRPRPGRLPAPQARRVSLAVHAEWTKLRTVAGTAWLLVAAVALTVALGAAADSASGYSALGPVQDTTKVSLTGVYLGQAVVAVLAVTGRRQRVHHGHDPLHPGRRPPPVHDAGRKGRRPARRRAWSPERSAMLGSLLAGRLILPRERVHAGARLRPALPHRRLDAAGRGRLGHLPRPDRAAQSRRRRRGARLGHRDRDRARTAVPVPDRRPDGRPTPTGSDACTRSPR